MNKKMTSLILGLTLTLSLPLRADEIQETSTYIAVEEAVSKVHTNEVIEEIKTLESEEEYIEKVGYEEATEQLEEKVKQERALTEGKQLILTIGKKEALLDGKSYTIGTAPCIVSQRTYLPLRVVVEKILNAKVSFDNNKKEATIIKDGKKVVLKVGSQVAMVDGKKVNLDGLPFIETGTTLVPVRFLSETFGLRVEFNNAKKQVTISQHVVEPEKNQLPIASFSLSAEVVAEGGDVTVTEESYDPDGDRLVEKVWEVKGVGTSSDINSLLKNLKANTYEISLKVKDEKGSWSNTCRKILIVEEGQAPQITKLETQKVSYAQGEPLEFIYEYDNEAWETIKTERWTYRSVKEASNQAVIKKPYAFFTPGEYVVTLQLTDSTGKVSQVVETLVTVTNEVRQTEWSYHFKQGSIGETIDNYGEINYRNYKEASVKQVSQNEDILWMSDSPEVASEDGILYQDQFEGNGRVLMHHINGFNVSEAQKKRLLLVAENKETYPITIVLSQEAIKGPVEDVLYLGQRVLYDYWQSQSQRTLTIKPGEKLALYDSVSKTWQRDQCISGLMNIETTGPITLTSAVMNKTDSLNRLDSLKVLDKSIHVRGTFEGTLREYELSLESSKTTSLVLGQSSEEWVSGTDVITGEVIQNKGNYGVTYRLTLTATEDTGVILNPRANVFRGAIRWVDTGTYLAPNSGYFIGQNKKAVNLGVIKKGETRILEYMLPNGSSAPILLGFIPKSSW